MVLLSLLFAAAGTSAPPSCGTYPGLLGTDTPNVLSVGDAVFAAGFSTTLNHAWLF